MEKIGEIYSTTDYSEFEFTEINRKIDPNNLSRIVDSMQIKFLITVALVLKKGDKLYIWDGQHRLRACEILDKPFYFAILNELPDYNEDNEADTLATLQNSKHWMPMDYVNHWSKRGVTNFKVLKNFMEVTGLPTICSVIALSGNTGVALPTRFRKGHIKIENIDRAYKFAEVVNKLKEMGFTSASNPKFASALYIGLNQHTINLQKIYEGLEVNPRLRFLAGTVRDTLANLVSYSHKDRPLNKQHIEFKNKDWPY